MGTSVKRSTKSTTLFGRGLAYGIPGEQVDGMDVLAVKAAGEKAVAHCRAGKGPYILEMMTYRYRGHSMSDPAKYRTREEVQKMRDERDAIEHVRDLLVQGGHASEDDLKAIDRDIKAIVNASAEFAKDSPEPGVGELWTDIYA
jgi:pyruvate dehydrogenase E1 component alpha subunit